jgi:hypothetical protein
MNPGSLDLKKEMVAIQPEHSILFWYHTASLNSFPNILWLYDQLSNCMWHTNLQGMNSE